MIQPVARTVITEEEDYPLTCWCKLQQAYAWMEFGRHDARNPCSSSKAHLPRSELGISTNTWELMNKRDMSTDHPASNKILKSVAYLPELMPRPAMISTRNWSMTNQKPTVVAGFINSGSEIFNKCEFGKHMGVISVETFIANRFRVN